MKKWITLTALVFGIAVFAQEGKKEMRHTKGQKHAPMKMFEGLNLSDQQKTDIKKLFEDRKSNRMERPKFDETSRSATLAKTDKKADQKVRKEWTEEEKAKFRAKREEKRKEFDSKIQQILTKDQYKQWETNRTKRWEEMKKHKADKFQ